MGFRVIKAAKTFEEVLSFEPQKLQVMNADSMGRMVLAEQINTDFQISEVVRNFTGLKEKELLEVESAMERRVLEQLKEVEEKAYSEAYSLGLDEGRKEAYEKNKKEISDRLDELDLLIVNIKNMKQQFLNSNENHLIKLVYHVAKLIARKEIEEHSNTVLINVLTENVKLAHSEEKIKVHVSDKQIEYLENLQLESSREIDFLKQIELKPEKDIAPGGCIIVTNYGEVDARIEQRAEQVWDSLEETLPPSKDIIK